MPLIVLWLFGGKKAGEEQKKFILKSYHKGWIIDEATFFDTEGIDFRN